MGGGVESGCGFPVERTGLLSDGECQVVMGSNMNQRGMAKALGLTQRGNVLERFISGQAIAGYVVAELAAKLKNPLVFQWDSGVAEVPPATPPAAVLATATWPKGQKSGLPRCCKRCFIRRGCAINQHNPALQCGAFFMEH